MKKNPVVHFEMPATDRKRMAEFYTKAFGWEMKQLGEEMGNYMLAYTTEIDDNNMITTPGHINGGFFQRMPDGPQHPSVVIGVDDVPAAIKKIEAAGGKMHSEPWEIPGVGLYALFTDPEGNQLSIIAPLAEMREKKQ